MINHQTDLIWLQDDLYQTGSDCIIRFMLPLKADVHGQLKRYAKLELEYYTW